MEGTLLYDVRDTGQDVAQGARFSVTNYESSFHTDNSFGSEVLDFKDYNPAPPRKRRIYNLPGVLRKAE